MKDQQTSTELIERIEQVFDRVFRGSVRFAPSLSRADEPQWTSLAHVELLIALEREFDVRFDGADAIDMTSISEVVERVRQKLR
jgi:acyl carrier protein